MRPEKSRNLPCRAYIQWRLKLGPQCVKGCGWDPKPPKRVDFLSNIGRKKSRKWIWAIYSALFVRPCLVAPIGRATAHHKTVVLFVVSMWIDVKWISRTHSLYGPVLNWNITWYNASPSPVSITVPINSCHGQLPHRERLTKENVTNYLRNSITK